MNNEFDPNEFDPNEFDPNEFDPNGDDSFTETCPEFNDRDYDLILEWGNAGVTYCDDHELLGPHWRVSLQLPINGRKLFIVEPLTYLRRRQDEELAKKAAALLSYLVEKGVNHRLASQCAKRYVLCYE